MNKKNITKVTIANLPTNSETFSAIINQTYESARKEVVRNKVNELYIVRWLVSVNEYQWNIDYKKQGVENGFVIDHLYQVSEQTNTRWAYPSSDDIQIAQKKQVLHCKVEGEWNLNDSQHIKYVLRNGDQVARLLLFSMNRNSIYNNCLFEN